MRLTPDRQAWTLLLFTVVFWGGNVVVARMAVGDVSPMVLVTARWGLIALILGVVRGRAMVAELRRLAAHWRFVLAMGFAGLTLSNVLLYSAGAWTTGVNLAVLQAGLPVFTWLGTAAFYGARIRPLQWVGLALTVLGVLVVVTGGQPAALMELRFNGGDVLCLLGVLAYAGYVVALQKRPAAKAIDFFSAVSVAAFLTSLPFLAGEIWLGASYWPTPRGVGLIAYVAIFPSLLGQFFFMRAADTIGPGRASLCNNLVPVLGALMSAGLLGEPFRPFHAAALALAIGGVLTAEAAGRWGVKRPA